jgi:hypothetical protein
MIVITDRRQTGRTTRLAAWLIWGHEVEGWPGWSRVLVVLDEQRVQHLMHEWCTEGTELHGLHQTMRERFQPSYGKLIITLRELLGLRGADRAVEIALDDADAVLTHALHGLRPAVVAFEGTGTTAEAAARVTGWYGGSDDWIGGA